MHPTKNINLPKLDKIIGRNNGISSNYKAPERSYEKKHIDIDVANIFGKSRVKIVVKNTM